MTWLAIFLNLTSRFFTHDRPQYLDCEVDYLHGTDEREASEEPHGSSYSGQLVYKLGCSVLQNICLIKSCLSSPSYF